MPVARAGAAEIDITPVDSQFLFGYPHIQRYSTGVHDPLFSSALAVDDGTATILFIANDVIFVDKALTASARQRIEQATGVPGRNIMITATHTHSGPITVDHLSNKDDPVVPKADPAYRKLLEDGIVQAGTDAVRALEPAEIGLGVADATGIGTNRRDPAGPSDLSVPLLVARSKEGGFIGCMVICSMHPTVLHEDSTLVSADFPGMAREYLKESILGAECPVIYHTGPEGNQSPRHVTRGNTFEEARRLGTILGWAVQRAVGSADFVDELTLAVARELVDLPKKRFPDPSSAELRLAELLERYRSLKAAGAPAAEVRTAECDWFGAEETATLARSFGTAEIEPFYAACLPAEIQVFSIEDWNFIGWPGELFIEYALTVKEHCPKCFIANLANGELQGYVATKEAVEEGGYEASNALFDYRSGSLLVETTLALLERMRR